MRATPIPPIVVPTDRPSLFESLRTLQVNNPPAYQAIVRPNNPPLGIGGFLFDIPGDDEVRIRSHITDYYLEDSTTVQDNIALEPEVITLRGLVAELVYIPQPAAQQTQPPTDALPLLADMRPPLTPTQNASFGTSKSQIASIGADSLYAYYSNFQSLTPDGKAVRQTRQTRAFLYFQQLWWGQQLMSVETPWGIFENMAILDLRINQGASTKYESDFAVTFKKLRFAGSAVVIPGQLAGRNALQTQPVSQDGNAGQAPVTPDQQGELYSRFP